MADCVVSPSQSEGLPFHLMEAMYYGLPIVASDIKGHADLLGSSHAGLLFSPHGMAEGCAAQVQRLLAEEMEHVAELAVPLTAEAHAGKSWAEAKG